MMLQQTQRHSKKIAALLLTILYMETGLAARAGYLATRHEKPLSQSQSAKTNFQWLNDGVEAAAPYDAGKEPANDMRKATPPVQLITANEPTGAPLSGDAPAGADKPKKDRKKKRNSPPTNQEDIGGPGQPEMKSFSSVSASNMVDLFSGDFSYNIPLLDVGGYPVGIHYSGGINMDQEPSWVGLGWNINPGTVGRTMRGLPDDFNGEDKITKTMNIRDNVTFGANIGANTELVGKKIFQLSSIGMFYNNYNGFGVEAGISAKVNVGKSVKLGNTVTLGIGKVGLGINFNSQSGFNMQPSMQITTEYRTEMVALKGKTTIGASLSSRAGLTSMQIQGAPFQSTVYKQTRNGDLTRDNLLSYIPAASISFNTPSFTPTISMPFKSANYTLIDKTGKAFFGLFPNFTNTAYLSTQTLSEPTQTRPAYGYLYMQKGNDNENALLDFNRDKDVPFKVDKKNPTPHIAIPTQTYDVFSISGEGTGGMFRAYRGDVGYVHDPAMSNTSTGFATGLEKGGKDIFHGGLNLTLSYSESKNNIWYHNNEFERVTRFTENDKDYEAVYLRNPGEKTVADQNYYDQLGDEDLVRVDLGNSPRSKIPAARSLSRLNRQNYAFMGKVNMTPTSLRRQQREKRTQMISYLTAEEASKIGLDTVIKSYPVNQFPIGYCDSSYTVLPRIDGIRKAHHISQVNVQNADGGRYIYGIPAYNLKQQDVTFAVNAGSGSNATGLASYQAGIDNSTANTQGKDHFFEKQELPPFAHSYLLTAVLSADYVDVTGNGISEDDMGDAVRFNYSKVYGGGTPYRWRAPFQQNQANYSEGFKSYNRDDKAHYSYGEKELWYLNSIESKSMIATFVLNNNTTEQRNDVYGVMGENGGLDNTQKVRYLKEIRLYAKADYVKNGANARPIKTVHFVYSYKLCKGMDPSLPNSGKLTLDSIYFSYNGNFKGKRNPYVFTYNVKNPDYSIKAYDRWGNYKDAASNPGSVINADFPYAVQNKTIADENAGAWMLSEIQLPSGGRMKVQYESDDYAFVQTRRAAQMFAIAGFSNTNNPATMEHRLYNQPLPDYRYVFIHITNPVNSRAELFNKYLQGMTKLHFRVAVRMPEHDGTGSGYETVPLYANYVDYGTTSNPNLIWLQLEGVDIKKPEAGAFSPVAKAAINYLRNNLPSKAYFAAERDGISIGAVFGAIISFAPELMNVFLGYELSARAKKWCNLVQVDRSFVRLNNPDYKKLGGGYRVKRVEVFDNWNSMTGQKEMSFGQEYNYTTTETINGVPTTISSGVASWEPGIGSEENPWRLPIEYNQQTNLLGPTDYNYTDEPLMESYYPSASVGYSQVRVKSIKTDVKSAPGFEETKFYTTRDFPVFSDFTPLDEFSKKRYRPKLNSLLKIRAKDYITLSQGFIVELNDMNGKVKSQASYAQYDSLKPLTYSETFYQLQNNYASEKRLSNKVLTIDSTGTINTNAQIGKDIELLADLRQQESKSFSKLIDPNLELVRLPLINIPVVLLSIIRPAESEYTRYRSVAVVKVINRFGIADSVVAIDKGSKVSTKNLMYDGETGDVVLTRTQNEFDDPIYNFSYPAHWAYDGMGGAYRNTGVTLKNVTINNGVLTDPTPQKYFSSGDEIMITGKEALGDTGKPELYCNTYTPTLRTYTKMVWAVDSAALRSGAPRAIFFLYRNGKPYHGTGVDMKIIRSGRRNLFGIAAGSVTSLDNPLVATGANSYRLRLNDSTRVIASSAGEFKQFWTTENRNVQEDSCYTKITIDTFTLPLNFILASKKLRGSNIAAQYFSLTPPSLTASSDYIAERNCIPNGHKSYRYVTKGIIKFALPLNATNGAATILSSTLTIKSTSPGNLWQQECFSYRCGFNSGSDCNFNWAGATNHSQGSIPVYLRRITNAWNYSTPYDGVTGTTTNQQTVLKSTSAQTQSINCTGLMNDIINNPGGNHGLMLQLNDESQNVTDYGSFCADQDNNNNNFNRTALSQNSGKQSAKRLKYFDPFSVYCNTKLGVKVQYAKDTCVKVCRSLLGRQFNPYIYGVLGNWRNHRGFVYYSTRKEQDPYEETNIRDNGEFTGFTPYWKFTGTRMNNTTVDTSLWVWNAEATLFNRKGMELENKDPLGRFNAGQYGYNMTLPVAVTQNSKNRNTVFDGFEDYNYKSEPCNKDTVCGGLITRAWDIVKTGGTIVDTLSHSGVYSWRIAPSQNLNFTIPTVTGQQDLLVASLNNQYQVVGSCRNLRGVFGTNILYNRFSPLRGTQMVVSVWVKEEQNCQCEKYDKHSIKVNFTGVTVTDVTLAPKSNIIDGWQQMEAYVTIPANATGMVLKFSTTATTPVYIDDLRLHPFNANMKSFVYDPLTLRLWAELDENNYAAFYEYDDDGTLIRVKKETTQGVKTIQETRSGLLKN
jgi:hypothetical protein